MSKSVAAMSEADEKTACLDINHYYSSTGEGGRDERNGMNVACMVYYCVFFFPVEWIDLMQHVQYMIVPT